MAKKSSASYPQDLLRHVSRNSISFTDEMKKELEQAKKCPVDLTDADAPEIANFDKAQIGKFYRPIKQQITLRVDADVLAWFKEKSNKYQTLINQALREYAQNH